MESEKKAARVEIFFMRPESSALSLHHIKTTVFTVILVLPCISEPAERTGIGTTERRPSISSRDSKSRHFCVCFLVLPAGIEPTTSPQESILSRQIALKQAIFLQIAHFCVYFSSILSCFLYFKHQFSYLLAISMPKTMP